MNTVLTDQQLMNAFNCKKTEQSITFIACFTNSDHDIFEANTMADAKRIAREYATRFLNTDLECVYVYEEN